MENFKTIMIRVRGNDISEAYARHCSKSWIGFNLRYWDAITPNTLSRQSGLTFGKDEVQARVKQKPFIAVSYTHLTLPTTPYV